MGEDGLNSSGVVKWFDQEKGYGFVIPSVGGDDAFVHISTLKKCGLESLSEGDKVNYAMGIGKNGTNQIVDISIRE